MMTNETECSACSPVSPSTRKPNGLDFGPSAFASTGFDVDPQIVGHWKAISAESSGEWGVELDRLRCPDCHGELQAAANGFGCDNCGSQLPIRDGLLVASEAMTGDNRIAADFYNSKLWPKLKLWDSLFWILNGGQRRARETVLGHLPKARGVRLLDVAIGDGYYTSWLPEDWSIIGLDVSTAQLAECRRRNAGRDLKLVLGEAENLPFGDHEFDAVLSNGGFNHFGDPEKALHEMVRVAKPGAPIVIADERPDFLNIGRGLGWPALDRWIAANVMSMGDDFAAVIDSRHDLDVEAIGRRVLKDCRYEIIWRGLGYKMVGVAP